MKKANTTKRYNLSEIMKRAWELKRWGGYLGAKFSDCLKRAWREAKKAVMANELPDKVAVMFNSHDLKINLKNGEISGDTYEVRKHIKYVFEAKWNSNKKVWVAGLEEEQLRKVIVKDCVIC